MPGSPRNTWTRFFFSGCLVHEACYSFRAGKFSPLYIDIPAILPHIRTQTVSEKSLVYLPSAPVTGAWTDFSSGRVVKAYGRLPY
jgi:hypothetical protein